ncbi:MAG: YtxH domain-containing protein [Patescibacteria group bacterium]|nr:YtxH domain-containing protein [Patescibacteria group bacterium]
MSYLKTFAKGVALGGLVGVIYGLFNAPKKGKEMQKEAKSTLKKLAKKEKGIEKKIAPKVKKAIKRVRVAVKKNHATRDQAKPDKKGKKR